MKNFFILFSIFSLGYICNDIIGELISPAKAEVAGMNSFDLRYDWDFKQAVETIVNEALDNYYFDNNYNFENAVEHIVENCSFDNNYNFENAVEHIVENCSIDSFNDISC